MRRAPSLQQTARREAAAGADARARLLDKLGVAEGAQVKVTQGRGEAVLAAVVDRGGAAGRGPHRRRASVDVRPRGPVRPDHRGARVAWTRCDTLLAPVAGRCFGPRCGRSSGRSSKIVVIAVPLILGVAYLTLAERKVIGWMQVRIGPNRVGPLGLLQPFADVFKLLFKEIIVPTGASRYLFFIAPMLSLAPGARRVGGHPVRRRRSCSPTSTPGLLYILAMTSMGVYGDHPRRLGVELEVRVPGLPALGGADRVATKSRWASRWSAC